MTFWPAYPHKVGRPAALRAYLAARKRAPLAAIMAGLARYKSDRPPDRQWLNPATFLNQDRYADEPAPVMDKSRENGHDAVLRSLARQASGGGDRERGWPPHASPGDGGFGDGPPADFGAGERLPGQALARPR